MMVCKTEQVIATRQEEGEYERQEELYSSLCTPMGRHRMRSHYPLTCAVDDLVIVELLLRKYVEPERVNSSLEDFVRGEVGAEFSSDLRSSPIMVSVKYCETSRSWCVRALLYHGGHDSFVQQLHSALAEFLLLSCRGMHETIVSCEVKGLESEKGDWSEIFW